VGSVRDAPCNHLNRKAKLRRGGRLRASTQAEAMRARSECNAAVGRDRSREPTTIGMSARTRRCRATARLDVAIRMRCDRQSDRSHPEGAGPAKAEPMDQGTPPALRL
jgi:hypothetical protein